MTLFYLSLIIPHFPGSTNYSFNSQLFVQITFNHHSHKLKYTTSLSGFRWISEFVFPKVYVIDRAQEGCIHESHYSIEYDYLFGYGMYNYSDRFFNILSNLLINSCLEIGWDLQLMVIFFCWILGWWLLARYHKSQETEASWYLMQQNSLLWNE